MDKSKKRIPPDPLFAWAGRMIVHAGTKRSFKTFLLNILNILNILGISCGSLYRKPDRKSGYTCAKMASSRTSRMAVRLYPLDQSSPGRFAVCVLVRHRQYTKTTSSVSGMLHH